ncbi:MAG: serine hydrolase domain-containing protein [Bacteroidota bacterium]
MRLTLLLFSIFIITACKNTSEESVDGSDPFGETQLTPERKLVLDSLELEFTKAAKSGVLPGFTVAIFDKDTVFFSKGFGYASLQPEKKYDPQTVQMVASVSKTLISVALMKVIEASELSLDDPVNDYLPFEVINPKFPETSITIRHLATHTAGFNDPSGGKGNIFSEPLQQENWREVWHPIIAKYNKNEDMPMPVFLREVFARNGKFYSEESFLDHAPGTNYEYSNYGSALLAHIIEIATVSDYRDYTKKHILEPLQMNRSGWSRDQVDTENHITYYNDNYKAVPNFHIITYPDGGFYSSLEDLTKFMQEMMRGYYGEGTLLASSSYKEMFRSQFPDLETQTGLLWDLDQDCCVGHSGNDFGIAAMMYFYKEQGIGRIIFTNIDVQQEQQEDLFYSMHDALYSFE